MVPITMVPKGQQWVALGFGDFFSSLCFLGQARAHLQALQRGWAGAAPSSPPAPSCITSAGAQGGVTGGFDLSLSRLLSGELKVLAIAQGGTGKAGGKAGRGG